MGGNSNGGISGFSKLEIETATEILTSEFSESTEALLFDGYFLTGLGDQTLGFSVFNKNKKEGYVGAVDLSTKSVLSQKVFKGVKPPIFPQEFVEIENIVKSDPDFIQLCHRRKVEVKRVRVDPWSAGAFDNSENRLSHVFCWIKLDASDSQFSHPFEGVNVLVDLDNKKVCSVYEHAEIELPKKKYKFLDDTNSVALKGIDIVQPDGPNFEVIGNKIVWAGWTIDTHFCARDGLVLKTVVHRNGEDENVILRNATVSEQVIPYGSPNHGHHRKNAFDVGEYGFGRLANSLKLNCDCLGHIYYMDALINDEAGQPTLIENAICIHEEDVGPLLRHYDSRKRVTKSIRNQRLVVSSIYTVGNYDYACYWIFRLDGGIELEIRSTGVPNTSAYFPDDEKYGVKFNKELFSQVHQHIFCLRTEVPLGDKGSKVFQVDTLSDLNSQYGNGFSVQKKLLEYEGGASASAENHRYWYIESGLKNLTTGEPRGFRIVNKNPVYLKLDKDSLSGRRSAFASKHFWLSNRSVFNNYPAGNFVHQGLGEDGIDHFTNESRKLDPKKTVFWINFGLNHIPRVEDYPIQSAVIASIHILPDGFYSRNPALDFTIAPSEKARSNKRSCSI